MGAAIDDYLKANPPTQQDTLGASIDYASKQNPDQVAQAQKLAAQYSLPVDTAQREATVLQQRSVRDSIDVESLRKNAPNVAAYLSNPDNAAVSIDDVRNLTTISNPNYFSNILRGAGERVISLAPRMVQLYDLLGRSMMETIAAGPAAMLSGEEQDIASKVQISPSKAAEIAADIANNAQGTLGYTPNYTIEKFFKNPNVLNFVAGSIEALGVSAPEMLMAVTSPSLYVATRSTEMGDQQLPESVTLADVARNIPFATVSQMLEKLGTERMFAKLPENIGVKEATQFATGLGKEIAARAGTEGGTEALQEITDIAAQQVAPGAKSFDPTTAALRVVGAGLFGAGGGGIVGGTHATVRALHERNNAIAANVVVSTVEQQQIDAQVKAAAESSTATRSPVQFKEFLQSAVGDKTVFMSQQDIIDLLGKGVAVPTTVVKQLDGMGGDVSINMADMLSDPTFAEAVRPHIRARVDGYSQTQLADKKSLAQDMIDRALMINQQSADLADVQTQVHQQLVDSGRYSDETARPNAAIITAMANTLAQERGLSIEEIMKRANFEIIGPNTPQQEPVGKVHPQLEAPGVLLTTERTVAETGEVVQIEHDAERLHRQTTKRYDTVDKVLKCLGR